MLIGFEDACGPQVTQGPIQHPHKKYKLMLPKSKAKQTLLAFKREVMRQVRASSDQGTKNMFTPNGLNVQQFIGMSVQGRRAHISATPTSAKLASTTGPRMAPHVLRQAGVISKPRTRTHLLHKRKMNLRGYQDGDTASRTKPNHPETTIKYNA